MPGVAQHLPDPGTASRDRGVDLEIFQCSACGLVQLDIEPVPYFREVIRAVGVSEEMRSFRLGQFREFIDAHQLAGRKMIEIGSGRGEYLTLLREAGASAFGLEWGESGCPGISRGFVENDRSQIPNGPFDAFAIFSFLEHLPRPADVLRGIAGNLADRGVGLVEVPNFDLMLRAHLFSEFMRDHLFYFTRATLATTLELSGFEVLGIREVWHDYILSAEVRKRAPMDLSAFTAHQRKLESEIEAFLAHHTRVAAWGAGHQAFAVMAAMRLGDRIRYVVDSAPFKQGKLTPVSHIPIVAPAALRQDPVDALLVMAGSFSDEIVRTLRRDFDPQLKIVILRDFGLAES
jgi:hypothetical protein